MAISSWLRSSSTKTMFVRVIHQRGHVELYDRPVLANEILVRNPRHCVAYPHVFKQPWAVVSPDTTLMPGQKFYVVPVNTIRKLQMLSPRHSPNMLKEIEAIEAYDDQLGEVKTFPCWIRTNDKKKGTHIAQKNSEDSCFGSCFSATKIKATSKSQNDETNKSSSGGSFERKTYLGSRKADSPTRRMSFDSWQPSLESIVEE